MHEQHPVYRIEVSARWNLHPGPLNTGQPVEPAAGRRVHSAAHQRCPVAEMNRQRDDRRG